MLIKKKKKAGQNQYPKLIPLYDPKNLLRNGSRRIIHSLLRDLIDQFQSLPVLPLPIAPLQVLFHLCSRLLSHHLFFEGLKINYKIHEVYFRRQQIKFQKLSYENTLFL